MTITEFAGKHVTLGSTKILIQDIGPGGSRVETNIKLPIRSDLVLEDYDGNLGSSSKSTVPLYGKKK